MSFDAILFDFDGVLLESEYELNHAMAELLTGLGHPTSIEEATRHYTGLSGQQFIDAVEARIGRLLPAEFHDGMRERSRKALSDGMPAIRGAIEFVRSLPALLPKAVASSSSTRWVRTHLVHLGLADAFEPHVYSGREHVSRGKPAPDLYLHAAHALGIDIRRALIVEDSRVGATAALASGATVVGLVAGRHCDEAHAEMLRSLGVASVATSFDELAALIGIDQISR